MLVFSKLLVLSCLLRIANLISISLIQSGLYVKLNQISSQSVDWGARWAYFSAIIGTSIGLGNLWRFPYEVGQFGGANYIVMYLACLLLVGIPVMLAELMIGRAGEGNAIQIPTRIARANNAGGFWGVIGGLGLITAIVMFSFYSVVASWILFYLMKSMSGSFIGVPAEIVQNEFGALLSNPKQLVIWHLVYVLLVVVVLSSGLERAARKLTRGMTLILLVLFAVIFAYIYQNGDFSAAFVFLTDIKLSQFSLELFVSALTQVFFSLSVGMAILLTYGSYVKSGTPIVITGVVSVLFDLVFALLMVTLIFSVVFAFGLAPNSGIGLIFETLPVAFSQMPNSVLLSSGFFLMILIAAVISGYSLLIPFIRVVQDQFGLTRRSSARIVGLCAWALGLLPVLSFSSLEFSFFYFGQERNNGYFDLFNLPFASLYLIVSALLISFFASVVIRRKDSKSLLEMPSRAAYNIWWYAIKYVVPVVCIIALFSIFIS